MRLLHIAVVQCFVIAAMACAACAADFERWFTVELSGAKAGWMHMSRTTDGERITSTSELSLEIRRGDVSIALSLSGEFVETTDGKPVSMQSRTVMGAQPTVNRWTFHDDHVIHEVEQQGRITTQRLDRPTGTWLPPAAADAFTAKRLQADAKQIILRTIDPLVGLTPIVMTRDVEERVMVEAMGKQVSALRTRVVQDVAPSAGSVDYLDDEGLPIRTQAKIGTLELDMRIATREVARDGKIAQIPEIMISTFVKPDRPITRPRHTTRARFVLSLADGSMPDLPQTGAQRVERIDAASLRIIVNTSDPHAADVADRENKDYLAASPLIDHADTSVSGLRTAAVRNIGDDKHARAEAMRRYVYRYIRDKSLDVGFASASETARTRAGDCSEHAVLLAAMLRADGIPARVVTGLLYAEEFAGERDIFGYHMWTQALLDKGGEPTWVDLDATLDQRPFDAAHIALGVSALSEGLAIDAMLPIADLMGRLAIRVESIE